MEIKVSRGGELSEIKAAYMGERKRRRRQCSIILGYWPEKGGEEKLFMKIERKRQV